MRIFGLFLSAILGLLAIELVWGQTAAASERAAFIVRVEVNDRKPFGEKWDRWTRKKTPPDIYIDMVPAGEAFSYEPRLGSADTENQFIVAFNVTQKRASEYTIVAVDKDVNKHDPIGEATCRIVPGNTFQCDPLRKRAGGTFHETGRVLLAFDDAPRGCIHPLEVTLAHAAGSAVINGAIDRAAIPGTPHVTPQMMTEDLMEFAHRIENEHLARLGPVVLAELAHYYVKFTPGASLTERVIIDAVDVAMKAQGLPSLSDIRELVAESLDILLFQSLQYRVLGLLAEPRNCN